MIYRLAIFDLAGTTVEDLDYVAHCLDDALRQRGFEAPFSEIVARMGIPKPLAIRQLAATATENEVATIHEDFQDRIIRFYRESPQIREVEGASTTFQWLKHRGVKIAVDTGFDRPTTEVLLQRMPWLPLLDDSITSDEVANGRPHPDMIQVLMERFEIQDPKLVIKVGDTPSDLNQGTAAGCGMVVGVCRGSHSREQLALHPHTHLIESVADLPELLA